MKKYLSLVFLLLMLMFVGISPSLAHENPPDWIPEDDEIVTHGSEIPEPPQGVEIPEGFQIEEFVGEQPDEDLALHGGGVHCTPWVLNCCRYQDSGCIGWYCLYKRQCHIHILGPWTHYWIEEEWRYGHPGSVPFRYC